MMVQKNNREANMDILRILSALAVVIIHVTSASLTYAENASYTMKVAMEICTLFMQWSVPCFLLMTGYFQLSAKKECTYKTTIKQILKFAITLFTIGVLYAFMERVFNDKTVTIYTVLNSFKDVVTGNLWDHMWYVYAILGIYLVLPLLKTFFDNAKSRDIIILTSISFVWTIMLPYLEKYAKISLPITVNVAGYIFYVMAGGLISKYKDKLIVNRNKVLLFSSIVLAVCFSLIVVKYVFNQNVKIIGYKSIVTCLIALDITIIFASLKIESKGSKFLGEVGKCCWGIYLIHPLFINIAIKLLKIDLLGSWWFVLVPLATIALFAVSFLVVWVLRKVKIVRNYLL